MAKYTPEDFANARFAEHEDGRVASRANPESSVAPWLLISEGGYIEWRDDDDMRVFGWVPVPTKPTMERSKFWTVVDLYGARRINEYELAEELGVAIIPDPEPTNTEKLDADIQAVDQHLTSRQLAEALIELGWKKDN